MTEMRPFLPTDIALPYGLGPDGKLIPIDSALRGLACECVCPGCRKPLVAKKGEIIRHHFAHATDESCGTGFESMIHLLAKDIIARKQSITVPEVVVQVGMTRRHIKDATTLALSNVRLEQWLEGIRPDIIADFEGHQLIIEIAVTHKSEPAKIAELERRGSPAVEIDLSEFHRREVSEDALWFAIFERAPRVWLFNRLANNALPEVRATEEARIEAEHQRELRRAQEQASLAEEWARWEEQAAISAAKEEEHRAAVKVRNAAAFDKSKGLILEQASIFLGAAPALSWVERMATDYAGLHGSPSGTEYDDRFEVWCKAALVRRSAAMVEKETAHRVVRESVLRAATAKLKSREKAELWMTTGNPRLGGKPFDVCIQQNGLELCKGALR